MNKRRIRVIFLCAITIVMIFMFFKNQTKETEAEAFEPTPLVIETEDEETISNPVPGTVTIVTPYQESECWTGLMYINLDGEMIRVTLFDAVESTFDDNF